MQFTDPVQIDRVGGPRDRSLINVRLFPRRRLGSNVCAMSRESVLLGVLTIDPTSTSDLYERVGYGELANVGLIPYHEFRGELEKLAAAGKVGSEAGEDGSTMWYLKDESAI